MDKLKMHSPDKVDENIEKIGALFPTAVTEVIKDGVVTHAIDFDVLRQELSRVVVEGAQERYQFTWPDKRKSILLANAPIAKTLRPCREESVDFDTTENLYIEGDNLDALKLLQETYLGKVKMIYIDPPYNTGNDFVYEDDFSQGTEEYMAGSGQFDEEGGRLVANLESNGRFHTDWLNMIYPRLKLAKDLLADDGVIFISIDDGESDNLRKVCNEVFGSSNFVSDISVVNNLKGRNDKKYIARANERLLMFVKSGEFEEYGLSLDEKVVADYTEQDHQGKYRLIELRKRGGADTRAERPNMYYSFFVDPKTGKVSLQKDETYCVEAIPVKSDGVDGRWRWGIDTARSRLESLFGRKVQAAAKFNIYEKDYLEDENGMRRIRPKSVMSGSAYSTDVATKEYRSIMSPIDFSSPKPVAMLSDLVEYSASPDSNAIILDFFSGSATTAHAVMQLNAADGGHRKFIMVQLPEGTEENTEAYKAGYKNICEIGKERVRRAGHKIKGEIEQANAQVKIDEEPKKVPDIGFRVLKIDSTNMQDVYYNPSEIKQTELFALANNIKTDRSGEDLLFQIMLDLGILLSSKIEETVIGGKKVFSVAEGYLIACFDSEVTTEAVTEIAKMKPYYAVFRDSGMANDSVATNFEQIFATYSPTTVRKVL